MIDKRLFRKCPTCGRPTQTEIKKREFSKILAVWAVVIGTLAAITAFVLSAFDKQPVSDLAIAIFTACCAYLVSYAAKSLGEKMSRNKHGLDESGQPYETHEDDKEENG